MRLQEDLADELVKTARRGVIIDITAVEIVDSFIGRMLTMIGSISRLFDAETVIVGMRPAVAITLAELGLSLGGVRTALNVEKGLADPEREILMDELPIQSGDDVVRVRQQVRNAGRPERAVPGGPDQAGDRRQRARPQHAGVRRRRDGPRSRWSTRASGRSGVRLDFTDEGPGIPDLDLALTDGWTSGGGLGPGPVRRAAAGRRVRADVQGRRGHQRRGCQVVALSRPLRRPAPQDMRWLRGRGPQRGRGLPQCRAGAGQPAEVPGRARRRARPRGDRSGLEPAQARSPGSAAAGRQPGCRPARDRARDDRFRPGAERCRRGACETATPPRARSASAWARSGGWRTSATCTRCPATGRPWSPGSGRCPASMCPAGPRFAAPA